MSDRLSIWQMAALSAIAAAGEAPRPRGVQFTTVAHLARLGLVAGRPDTGARRRARWGQRAAPTLWRVTEEGRAALASADPAGAAAAVAAKAVADKLHQALAR
jgi:hypothetical protein